jgi:hypothetical protein
MGTKKQGIRVSIFDNTLNDVMAEDSVYATVYENLLNNLSVRDRVAMDNVIQLYILINERNALREEQMVDDNMDVRLRIETNVLNINVIKGRMPVLSELISRQFNCNYRTLYEGLIMGVKNVLVEIQSRMKRDEKFLRGQLLKREEYTKNVFGERSQQWYDAKEAILRFDDVQLKERAVKFREFLDVNNEKATQAFCKLSKEGGLCDDIGQIKGDDGRAFASVEHRGKHIAGFYSKIYKRKLDNLFRIEDFLQAGQGHQGWLQNKKLNEEEKNDLEGNVTIEEVKTALDGSNFESSSGWDGISFKVLRKFWNILSEPMLKMIQETFREGDLMETFKLGFIKLIPKKGNASRVGDWRPITLLCCGYKLISGIVANRLGKYLGKIIGRSQKGFMSNNNINTCTVNVMSSIDRAWGLRIPTGVMCIDFAKAFDSVEHLMIRNVMKFFGFGEIMTGMVMTLLKDRKSRIILEDGYSGDIDIERGTPQGDRSSPYIFIMCIEILLMRINLEEGNGIDDGGLYIGIGEIRDNWEKPTSETYADDLTIISKMSENSVNAVLQVLREFEAVSGLAINIDKTQLMVVGSEEWAVGSRVHGIEIVNNVTILGITIYRTLSDLDVNWNKAITKMHRLAGYWRTFGLSITGRVMVAKTYILSQSIYLMGSLPMSELIGERINETLLNFIKGSDRLIEQRRQLLCKELGGYGMMDVNIMNISIKASWIERWKREQPDIDYMAAVIWNRQDGFEVWRVERRSIMGKGLRILEDIVIAGKSLRCVFMSGGIILIGQRYFSNRALFEDGGCMEERVFGGDRQNGVAQRIEGKILGDICNEQGEILDKLIVDRRLNIRLSWVEYFRLRTEINRLMGRFPRKTEGLCTEQGIEEFTAGRKRGCKRYRRIMEGRYSRKYEANTPMRIQSGHTLWGEYIEVMGRELVEMNFGLWSCTALDSGYKEFLFKFMHGKLYLNNQLANFADVTRACTFCKIQEEKLMKNENVRYNSPEYTRRIENLNRETVSHMLWDCRWVNNIIQNVIVGIIGVHRRVDKNKFMGGWVMENKRSQELILITIHYIKFIVYVCRNRRILPTLAHVRYELGELFHMLGKRVKWQGGILIFATSLRGIFEE